MAKAQQQREAKPAEAARPKPVHEVRLGRVKAAVWANETEHGVRFSVTLARIYKDAAGNWQRSDSFGREDLPLVAKVSDMAHTWAYQQAGDSESKAA